MDRVGMIIAYHDEMKRIVLRVLHTRLGDEALVDKAMQDVLSFAQHFDEVSIDIWLLFLGKLC